jgi:hypothetical protein
MAKNIVKRIMQICKISVGEENFHKICKRKIKVDNPEQGSFQIQVSHVTASTNLLNKTSQYA